MNQEFQHDQVSQDKAIANPTGLGMLPPPFSISASPSDEKQAPLQLSSEGETDSKSSPSSQWSGNNVRVKHHDPGNPYKLRSGPSTDSEIMAQLPFNTAVNVIGEAAPNWLEVLTEAGQRGYCGYPNEHLSKNDIDPNATLHWIQPGSDALGTAAQYFSRNTEWGRDYRFYIQVIAHINNISIPNKRRGWKEMKGSNWKANTPIWIPSLAFAVGKVGEFNSGSISREGMRAIEETAELIERLKNDFGTSIQLAGPLIWAGLDEAILEGLEGAVMEKIREAIRALAIVGGATAVGAIIGALAGGAGALPGAVAGFKVGTMLVARIELFEAIVGIGQLVVHFGKELGRYIDMVFQAEGDEEALAAAAQVLANATLLLIQTAVEEIAGRSKKKGPDASTLNMTPESNTRPSTSLETVDSTPAEVTSKRGSNSTDNLEAEGSVTRPETTPPVERTAEDGVLANDTDTATPSSRSYNPSGNFRKTLGTPAISSPTPANSTRGWKAGQPINNLTSAGNVPTWTTVKRRYWINVAFYIQNADEHSQEGRLRTKANSLYSQGNLERMESGKAPVLKNPDTGKENPLELEHRPFPQREGGLFDFVEVNDTEHDVLDPKRNTGEPQFHMNKSFLEIGTINSQWALEN